MKELTPTLMEATKRNKDFEVSLDSLDESQHIAVASEAEKILLRAPAGSGKTHSLITAVAAYRYEHVADRVCAITYTRAARADMEARLQTMGIFDVEVTTIHAWARKLLADFSIKYDFKILILEEPQIKSILTELVEEYIKHSKIKKINIGVLYSYVSGNKNMDISDNYRRTLAALEDRYVQYKRDNALYDFTDYPLYLFNVLETYNESINNIDALFVDEFQDVDKIQFEIFEKVNAKKKFYVGDSWQSIYVFRGADGEVFEKTEGFEEFKLKHNYRSYQEIIDYAATVYLELRDSARMEEPCYIGQVLHSHESGIMCDRGYGGTVTTSNPFGRCYQFNFNASIKVDMAKEFINAMSRKPMILCRTNKQVKAINDLGYFETSTVHQAKGLEYDNVIVIDTTINCLEDLNIAYVALTRAKNNVFVVNWPQFELMFGRWIKNKSLTLL